MRWKTTAVLAVLLVGLGAFYYVYEVREEPARVKAAAEKDRIWKGLDAKDIDDVVVTRAADTLHLTRSGDAWALVSPVDAKAERQPVEDLLSELATARIEREIDPNPARPRDFGLAPPAAEVTFRAKGQERRLRLGARNPTGVWVYAQEANRPAVFLVPETVLSSAQKSASDFRDHTVLAFAAKDVRAVEVQGPAGQTITAAARTGADDWQVTAPLAAPADRETVKSLLEKLRSAKIKEFVAAAAPGPTASDPYGLDHPVRLTLWLGEGKDRAAKTLGFGKAAPDKKAVYAERAGDATVFLVDEALAKAVPASPTALRDRTVFAYDRGQLERVDLESPKGTVALAVDHGAWRITAPVALPADEDRMTQLLSRLQDLRAKAFVADDVKRLGAFGLDHPAIRLSAWEKGVKEPKTLLIVEAPGKDGAYATVTGGGPPSVVLVDPAVLADLSRSAQDLRDHTLFSGFEVRDVTGVRIEARGQVLALERRGEDEWQLTSPRPGEAQAARVGDLIWALRSLKWRDLVAEQGWDASRYGLAPPATTVTLTGKDGKTLAALALGTREPLQAYARVPGRPALYTVDPKALGDLPTKPEDLL